MKLWRLLIVLVLLGVAANCTAQTAPAADPSTLVWKAMWQPPFDASKSASVKDLTLERDRIRLTLADGTLRLGELEGACRERPSFRARAQLQASAPPRPAGAPSLPYRPHAQPVTVRLGRADCITYRTP